RFAPGFPGLAFAGSASGGMIHTRSWCPRDAMEATTLAAAPPVGSPFQQSEVYLVCLSLRFDDLDGTIGWNRLRHPLPCRTRSDNHARHHQGDAPSKVHHPW